MISASALAAAVAVLAAFPGPRLAEGPQLAGDRVAWSQTLCVADCDPDLVSEADERYEILSRGAAGSPRRLFRARIDRSFSGPNFGTESFSFLLSEQALATVHLTRRGDELDGESGSAELRAGPPGGPRQVLAECSAAFFVGPAEVALDGNRIAYDPDPCDGAPRLVVRELGTGTTQTLTEPAGGEHLRLRGRFVAWIAAGQLVVHDLAAGATAYSAPAADVLALDLDADGTVAAVSGQPSRPCSTGRLLRYSVAAPGPAELGVPVCATGVRIDGGRIVFLGWEGFTRTLRAAAPDGSTQDLVRFGRVRPGAFDFRTERLAWAARDCSGGEAIFRAALGDAPLSAGSINCRARFRSGIVPVHRGIATVRLRCPRGCGGELRLRHMGTRRFSLPRGQSVVRIRLGPRARARLARRGSLPALAKLVTRNRAGDRLARSRAVTLIAR